MKKLDKIKHYDTIILLLSIISIISLFSELTFQLSNNQLFFFNTLDNIIWIIFVFDYFYRLFNNDNKLNFIKNNKIDLLSIIPTSSFFQAFKLLKSLKFLKFLKLLKLTFFIGRYIKSLKIFLKFNNFHYSIITTIFIILIGTILISFVENMSISDALWWSFVTTTTVGYGDISPTSNIGRLIAAILMLVGIGFLGILTGNIATYFLTKKNNTFKDHILKEISSKIEKDFDTLSNDDLNDIFKILKSLKNSNFQDQD